MYPVLFRIGSFELTSFGVLMALAFLTAGWILARELERIGDDPETAWDIVWYGAVGGILGAKIYYLILNWNETAADPWGAILSRAGLVWYGGFIGGALLIWWRLAARKLPVLRFGDAIAPALAMGYVVGRLGCFLVGDDYGRPTDRPWGIAFPDGAPPSTAGNLRAFGVDLPPTIADGTVLAVHPTQLYEMAMMLVVFAMLWAWRKRGWPAGVLWFAYVALAGVERFIVEIFRAKDDRFLGVFTIAQLISVGLVLVGIAGAMYLKRRGEAARAPAGARTASA
jgi:phosphatidylglycerol:prolipoprotein diacylglycerol transferase